jgi:hypothetical protein
MEPTIYSSIASRYPDESFERFDNVVELKFIDTINKSTTLDNIIYQIDHQHNQFHLKCNAYTVSSTGAVNYNNENDNVLITDQHMIGLMNIFQRLIMMEEIFNQEKSIYLRSR